MSLENVIVKESESVVVGTIKVRNLSFHKEVIVRASWNDWQSQEDTFCTYSQVRNHFYVDDLNIKINKKKIFFFSDNRFEWSICPLRHIFV